jgi:hypothetical protein
VIHAEVYQRNYSEDLEDFHLLLFAQSPGPLPYNFYKKH